MSSEPIEPEVVEDDKIIEFRKPSVPVTLEDLAALKGEALEVIEARIQVLQTARKFAIGMTHPTDWSLFRDKKTGLTIAYLDDAGCDRVRDILGIEIFHVSPPQKITQNDGSYMYIVTADGRCRITRQVVESMEGGRSSKEDFCKDLTGTQKELAVRKAARANLDGGITRELAGLRNVPLAELDSVWKGTSKSTAQCRQARGFGSGVERQGARIQDESGLQDDQKPKCGLCGKVMAFRPGGKTKGGAEYGAFWSCVDFDKHKTDKEPKENYSVTDEDWRKQQATGKGGEDIPA